MRNQSGSNPFTYGDLALDEAFTDREPEVAELTADMKNGQNVLLYAPRRYGKSSLALQAAKKALGGGLLVAYCDVMKTTTKERLAGALAKTIYAELASPAASAAERAGALFRGLRIRPTIELDPDDGTLTFSFRAGRSKSDIDDTLERLLELPAEIAADRGKRAVLIFDEFQEIVSLDKQLPNLMRSVFQTQPAVAHVYLGSKRHILDRIFNDKNEPFWRSAKRIELGLIPPKKFAAFIDRRFASTDKGIADDALARLLEVTSGHPYATQQLAYAVWELVPAGHHAFVDDVETALAKVLREEHNYFDGIWDAAAHAQRALMLALAEEPAGAVFSQDYRTRNELGAPSTVEQALKALTRKDVTGKDSDGRDAIVEPFLGEWLKREQARSPAVRIRRRRG
jgi:uncharacterized protein